MRGNVREVIDYLGKFTPEIARQAHIKIAKKGLARVLAKSPDVPYRVIVDGKMGNFEESVRPFGVIKYVFIRLPQIARYAYQQAVDLSPVKSGRYKKSWMFIIDGKPVFSLTDVPNNAKRITLTNFQPYSRKLNLRKEYSGKVSVPPGVVEKVRQLTKRKFGLQVNLTMEYIELRGGYVLKKNYVQTRAVHGRDRLHTRAGKTITYPSLVITPRE